MCDRLSEIAYEFLKVSDGKKFSVYAIHTPQYERRKNAF